MMHPCYQWLSTVTSQLYRFSLYFQQPTLKNLKCSLLLDWKGNEQTTWHFLTLLAFSQNVFCIIIHNAMSSALLFTTSFAFRIINHSIYIPHHHLWGLQHHRSWCFTKLCSLSLLHNHSQCISRHLQWYFLYDLSQHLLHHHSRPSIAGEDGDWTRNVISESTKQQSFSFYCSSPFLFLIVSLYSILW